MSSPRADALDDARYTLRVDEANLIVPCVSVVVCLDRTDQAGLQEFHDRGLEALGGAATHYRAEQMKGRASITARTRAMLQTWLAKPTAGKQYYLEYFGCSEEYGVTGAGLSIHLTPRTYAGKTPEFWHKWLASWRTMYEQGVRNLLPSTILRLTFPTDHPLASPDALADWIARLRLVTSGEFGSGYAGYALNCHASVGSMNLQQLMHERLAALVLQHPGFDWHSPHDIMDRLLPFDPRRGTFLPLIKRANWISLISERAIAHLGGRDDVKESLGSAAGVEVSDVGTGISIRAGAAPHIGDTPSGDVLPTLRSVARVIRPVRMETIPGPGSGFPDDRAQEWLEAFDRGSSA
jgi:TseV toxin immunity protein TsiV